VKREIPIDLLEYQRPIVKIAYELGLYWLGKRYSADPIAQAIRSFLFDPRNVHEIGTEYKIEGIIDLVPPSDGSFNFPWKDIEHIHQGMLVATVDKVVCSIKIFNVIYARIVISRQGSTEWGGAWHKLVILDSKNCSFKEYIGTEEILTAFTEAKQIWTQS